MDEPTELRLKNLARPKEEHGARLVSIDDHTAVLELQARGSFPAQSLVEFRTSHAIYLGEIIPAPPDGPSTAGATRVHVRLEHRLDLAKIQQIQQAWANHSLEPTD